MNRLHLARVTATSLTPCQRMTKRDFRIATDFRVVQMLKHQTVSEFHSLAEYYHAALLEGDPTVTRYVPQPFLVKIGDRRYVPDCYVVRDGQVEVVELRPRAEFDDHRRQALEAFFQVHRMRFVVVPNEAVLSRRIEASNWLAIVQMLVCHRALDTTRLEWKVLDRIHRTGTSRVGDWVHSNDRSASRAQEIALFRLLHQGKLVAALSEARLSYETEVRPWH